MKKILTSIILLVQGFSAHCQSFEDALRYSDMKLEGSARFIGMGGAFGALGADLSATHINPAGIARYSKHDFAFTLGNNFWNATSSFKDAEGAGTRNNFTLPSIGFVSTSLTGENSASLWKTVQFGLTFNRTNNFNQNILVNGMHGNSLSYYFASQAAGVHPDDLEATDPFGSYLAYQTYLIDPVDANGSSYVSQAAFAGDIDHSKTINRRGGQYETAISFAGNYDDRFYLGGSVIFPGIRFEERSVHREVLQDTSFYLKEFSFFDNLNVRGSGVGARFGIIALPSDFIRLGVAVQTPFLYSIRENFSTSLQTEFDTIQWEMESLPGAFNYRIKTPAKLTLSAAFIINKRGLISIDYEVSDFSNAKFLNSNTSLTTFNFSDMNAGIMNNLQLVNNIRIGGELRMTQKFYLRGGFGLTTTGYKEELIRETSHRFNYSGGLGYRNTDFYVDLGYSLLRWKDEHYMYDPAIVPVSVIENRITRLVATLGFKF